MQSSNSQGNETSATTTPLISCASDSESSSDSSLESSTPIKVQDRVRKLSYTLEAPSPVLLKMMQNGRQQTENETTAPEIESSQFIFSIADSFAGYRNEPSPPKSHAEAVENPAISSSGSSGGVQEAVMSKKLMVDFLASQQKLMQQLLEQQAQEQERLARIFREQEEQLMQQLQLSQTKNTKKKNNNNNSGARRSLQSSFSPERVDAPHPLARTKLSALVRGYLTRRLLATDKVGGLVQTIRDTTVILVSNF